MTKLTPEEAAIILAEALSGHLIYMAEQKHKSYDAIGQVLSGFLDNVRVDYIFKYIIQTGAWTLHSVTPGKYPPNTILYYHDTVEDAVTQAALHGDDLAPEDDTEL